MKKLPIAGLAAALSLAFGFPFLAGSAALGPIVRGCDIRRQWVDGDEVCSIYDFKVETPAGAGSIPMAEWSVVRGGKLVSSRLLFDTAAMAALMPAS